MVCNIWRLLRGCLETWRKHLYIFIFRNDFPGWVEGRQEGLCLVSTFLRSYCERIFWSLACTCAFVIGTYLIYRVIDKSITSPVLVSFDGWVWLWVEWSLNLIFFRTPVPIWEIPFPALTLCNMNKVTYTAQVHNLKQAAHFFRFGDPKWTRSWRPWRRTQPTFTSSRRSSSSTRLVTSSFDLFIEAFRFATQIPTSERRLTRQKTT